ncbi:MAG: AAA family ATPase [bacterium]|jgi:wobble nucleotide-excising tRNase|nr:AAA family ATPase [bacterium]
MIESVTIKNAASYDQNGIEINSLKKINFIYGENGTGKTTISNFLANPEDEKYEDCRIVWKDGYPIKILVYNRKFRDDNFGGNSKLPGVFTLGKATKEEIEKIEKKKEEFSKIKEEILKLKESHGKTKKDKERKENDLKEKFWDIYYKRYENDFTEAFRGAKQKDSFKRKLVEEINNKYSLLVSCEELKSKAEIIFGTPPAAITEIPIFDSRGIIEIEMDKIWKKKIVGKDDLDISKLIEILNCSDWVNQGRAFIASNDETCPFCQQKTITASFKAKLEEYFDKSFTESINILKNHRENYKKLTQNLVENLKNIKESKNPKLEQEKFSDILELLKTKILSVQENINSKIKESSRDITIISLKDDLEKINQLIMNANTSISEHNKIVENFQKEKKDLIVSIWRFLAEEASEVYMSCNNEITGFQKGIDELERKITEKENERQSIENEIIELNKNITSIQPTVDEINRMLKSFDFNNFEIIESAERGFYQIQREDGTSAKQTLSEGEKTFITFLYFLQLSKGAIEKEDVIFDRILVIDDPVSSLDSNVLFIVSTLVKELIKNVRKKAGSIKQIIMLTHNVYFHKEVSFIDSRTKENNDTHYWILRKNNKTSSIQPFKQKNPIQSSYELLWQELKEKDKISRITLQNTMRKIIENYFKMLGRYDDDKIINSFDNNEDQVICRSLLCWINDGSHCIPDDLFIQTSEDKKEKYLNVFRKIFEHTNHIGHYNMMMGIDEY